jgi:FkbM family methyltransferase
MQQKKQRPQRYEIGQWGVMLKEYLPPGLKTLCVDLFFRYTPISAICLLWKELDGYFRIKRPKKGDVVVDAGAWTGHFTLVAARMVGKRGKVIAIEPQKLMCERLEDRMRRLGMNNVTVVNSALFDRTSKLVVPYRNDPGFNVFSAAREAEVTETVVLRTLDDILDSLKIDQVDFVKMDIEGAEIEALHGMQHTLSSMRPFVAIASYHWREGAMTSTRVEEILRGSNYSGRTGHPWHLTTWGWVSSDHQTQILAEQSAAKS